MDKAAYFISLDNSRVNHQCVVGKSLVDRLLANEWAKAVGQIVGAEVSRIDEAISVAQEFAKSRLD
ncbi:hypothetical protein LPJ79_005739 [Coemansia sp. RSA 1821]|nr:hypothetical protein LPJ79_005739 [Coemansia sp. RSA 1821]